MTLASTACKSCLVPGLDSQIKSLIQNFKADPTIKDVNGFNAVSVSFYSQINCVSKAKVSCEYLTFKKEMKFVEN